MIARGVAAVGRCADDLAGRLRELPLFDPVAGLTLFLAAIFGFDDAAFRIVAQLALLGVLVHSPLLRSRALWTALAVVGTLALLKHWYSADNHKYLLVYWLWVVTIASHLGAAADADADKVLLFNARFFLVFIFLGAVLQKWLSARYMSGEMFEMFLLLDDRFRAFAHLMGIHKSVADAALLSYTKLQNPLIEVVNNEILLPATDRSRFVALAVTWYDFWVQVLIGLCLALNRRVAELIGHAALLFFIFTTYIPAPVFGFGLTLSIMGFALTKDRYPRLALAYFAAAVAVLLYQTPWREWVLS